MKNFNYCLGFFAIFAMLFTSCSTEETGVNVADKDTVQLQFGALLNDFANNQSKAHESDPTICRDADPSYVLLGVTDDDGNFVGTGGGSTEPYLIRVNVQDNNGSWETSYSDELGLPAGDYSLEYFIVYSSDDEVLWVAPRTGGEYASSVSNSLPLSIELEPGTKPYINVDVLCFIPRNEVAYGYLFFDINLITVENNYCLFVNFCDDTTGREYPAKFMVDVWGDTYGGSDVIIDGRMNTISMAGDNPSATVLCFALPPLDEDGVYYVRVTVLNDDLLPYTADGSDVFQYTINQSDIDNQLLDVPAYEHIKINCNPNQGGDPYCTPETANVSSCMFQCDGGTYAFLSKSGMNAEDDFLKITSSNFNDLFFLYEEGTTNVIAKVKLSFSNGGDLRVTIKDIEDNKIITAFEIDARLPNGSSADVCNDTRCNNVCYRFDDFTERLQGDVITPTVRDNGGFFLKVRVQDGVCPS